MKIFLVLLLSTFGWSQAVLSVQTTAAHDAVAALSNAAEQKIADQTTQNTALTNQVSSLTQQNLALSSQNLQLAQTNSTLQNTILGFQSYSSIISDLQKLGTWSRQAGPTIAPNIPVSYGWTHVSTPSVSGEALQLSIQGASGIYSGWLTAINHLPIPNYATKALLELDIYCDSNVELYAQTLEIDTELIINGMKYNLSSHNNYQKGGMLEISDGLAGGWVSTGLTVGKYSANTWHHVKWEYGFDRVTQTFRFLAFTIDTNRFVIPATNLTQHAQVTTWGEGLLIQLQQDANSKGGGYKSTYDNIKVSLF